MLQLEIYSPKPGENAQPVQSNIGELKAAIAEGLKKYDNIIYTEDTISVAKKDRADLNRLSKAISDERIAMKRRFLAPYEEFEKEAKELTSMIDATSKSIDNQVKAFEQQEKDQKQEDLKKVYDEVIGDFAELIPYDKLHDAKWLNKGVKLGAVKDAIETVINKTKTAFTVIDTMGFDEPTTNRVKGAYLRNFELGDAMAEKELIEKEKRQLAEYELKKQAEDRAKRGAEENKAAEEAENRPVELQNTAERVTEPAQEEPLKTENTAPELIQLDFRVWATAKQLGALKHFLVASGIKYGKVE